MKADPGEYPTFGTLSSDLGSGHVISIGKSTQALIIQYFIHMCSCSSNIKAKCRYVIL